MQKIARDFVSGIILLLERSVKPGDILEMENSIILNLLKRVRYDPA